MESFGGEEQGWLGRLELTIVLTSGCGTVSNRRASTTQIMAMALAVPPGLAHWFADRKKLYSHQHWDAPPRWGMAAARFRGQPSGSQTISFRPPGMFLV